MTTGTAPTRPPAPDEVSRWRRVRRYAVPRWMIEKATERRLAGDWRGACAAANVDVAFDLGAVAGTCGNEAAAALEDALLHLGPDLLRWHAPRVDRGRTTLIPDQVLVLDDGPYEGGHALYVTTPSMLVHGPQRLTLRFAPVPADWVFLDTDLPYCAVWRNVVQSWTTARHLWDVRHAGELRERSGGGEERAPFLEPDGTPRPAARLPSADPGPGDPAARTEWLGLVREREGAEAAFAAAGVEVDPSGVDVEEWHGGGVIGAFDVLGRLPLALSTLGPELRTLSERTGAGTFWIPYQQHAAVVLEWSGRPCVRVEPFENFDTTRPVFPEACRRPPPDLDLLRYGLVPDGELHPLVRAALMPAASPDGPGGPPDPAGPPTARVRCRGDWHDVRFRNGVLEMPHSEAEQRREQALLALGGAVGGCQAVRRGWRSGGRLPRALEAGRRDLLARVQHGDTPGVLALLDAGIDPRVRDARGRTLLHCLHLIDHTLLMPRLVPVLDLEAGDSCGRTPLHVTVFENGSVDLVRALLDAGARIDVQDEQETTLHRVIEWRERTDLAFLLRRIEDEYPELADW
ncbi:ankyrin repeat domain-containing protein [Actinomadura macra]|uniref:ankyrin repeat domain-containing protein n=1 Tax=Actinomadura macra TaxID=46164 RepID=UPI000832A512|nr:ankyrin repeat domain-containing protein [Actinomadura macra]